MNKVEYILNDRWLKDFVQFWLSATLPSNERELLAYDMLAKIAEHYAAITYYDGSDLFIVGHGNPDVALVVTRFTPEWSNKAMIEHYIGAGGIFYVPTPDAIRNTIVAKLAGNSEEADNRAAKKSCALH